jgi:hypothetical protein
MGLGTRVRTVIQVIPGRKEIGTRVRRFFHYHKTITQLNDARRHTLEHGGSVIGKTSRIT